MINLTVPIGLFVTLTYWGTLILRDEKTLVLRDKRRWVKMVNLLHETLKVLREHGKSPKDVRWVGSKDGEFAITWKEFEKIANVEYDSGFGWQEVAKDLVVVGDDWWLERHEHDGSEWWEFKTLPKKKPDAKKFTRVVIDESKGECGWVTLKELNEG